MPLKVDFFFFDVGGIGRDILEVKIKVSSELFPGTDRVDGSASGTGSSGKPTATFFPPTTSVVVVVAVLVIGVVNLIVVIVCCGLKKKREISQSTL